MHCSSLFSKPHYFWPFPSHTHTKIKLEYPLCLELEGIKHVMVQDCVYCIVLEEMYGLNGEKSNNPAQGSLSLQGFISNMQTQVTAILSSHELYVYIKHCLCLLNMVMMHIVL